MSRLLPLVIALGVSGFVQAEEPDAIRTELNKAKQTFADTTTKAKTALLAAFDDAIKTVAAGGDLDGVKVIQNERKVFEESGKTSTTAKMGTAVGEYTRATKQARTALDKAYDQAVKEYTKALKIESAEAVRSEWKESQAPMVVAKVPEKNLPPKADPVPKGKWIAGRWEISYTPNRSKRAYIIAADGSLVIERENGEDLKFRIRQKGGELFLDFSDDKVERLTFAGNRLFIEHFAPAGDLARNVPDQIGIGELVKKK
jgi:hypothetical protein